MTAYIAALQAQAAGQTMAQPAMANLGQPAMIDPSMLNLLQPQMQTLLQPASMQHLTQPGMLNMLDPSMQFAQTAMPTMMQPAMQNLGQPVMQAMMQPATHSARPPVQPDIVATGKTGSLKAFGQKGFGYITPDDGSEDVFFHFQTVTNGSENDMIPGARLKYDLGIDNRSGRTKGLNVVLDTPGQAQQIPATPDEVERFLLENPVEQHAQDRFRMLHPFVQKMVINRGPLVGARNPTASFLGRIGKFSMQLNGAMPPQQYGLGGYGKAGPAPQMHGASPYGGMDGKGGMGGGMGGCMGGGCMGGGMGGCMAGGMGGGMSGGMGGGMGGGMTPRLTPMSEVTQAGKTGSLKAFGQKGFGYIVPDDGTEDVFFHFQSVQNGGENDMVAGARLKFDMGVDKRSGRSKGVNVYLESPGAAQNIPATPEEVEQFLVMNPVEAHAQDKFRALDPVAQKMVMNRGPLAGARDPTASFLGRMGKFLQQPFGGESMPPAPQFASGVMEATFAAIMPQPDGSAGTVAPEPTIAAAAGDVEQNA